MALEVTIAEKVKPSSDRKNLSEAVVQPQTSIQEFSDSMPKLVQLPFIVAEQTKVIAVAQITIWFKNMFDELIQLIKVKIAHPLAGIIADRGIAAPWIAVDDIIDQP